MTSAQINRQIEAIERITGVACQSKETASKLLADAGIKQKKMIIAQLNDGRLFELTGRTVERNEIGFMRMGSIGQVSTPPIHSMQHEILAAPQPNWWIGQQHIKAIWKTK